MPSVNFIKHQLVNHFIKRPKHIWVFVIGLFLAVVLPFIFGLEVSTHIKTSGIILQFLFIIVVGRALIKIRNRFIEKDEKIKTFNHKLKDWLNELNTLFETRSQSIKAEAGAYTITMGDVNVTTSEKERIDLLRKNQKKLIKRVKSLENRLIEEKGKLKEHIDSLEELIKNLNINSLGYEWVSLYWLGIGLILRTYPQEISMLL